MKRFLAVLLKILLVILAVIVLGAAALVIRWAVRHEDPTAFLSERYIAYFQVPSIRRVYDQWLNLEAADVVLSRPDLAKYRSVVTDARGLALTSSPILRILLDVRADIQVQKDGKLVAVLDLGWRGALTPLARVVAPMLRVKGFSFLNDSGIPFYRYKTGETTIHAAFVNNVAIIALDQEVVKEALARRAARQGLADRASRELLERIRLRSASAIRVLIDTQGVFSELLSASPVGAKALRAVEMPSQSMLDVEISNESLRLGAGMPISVSLPELSQALGAGSAPIGVLRLVPASASLLSVVNIAPLSELYALAAAFQGKDVQDIYAKADAGAKSVLGVGIQQLLFSWIGAEMGAFMLPTSQNPVFFARITDTAACERAIDALTHSLVAGRDNSLVLDGVRVERLSIPWYVGLILDSLGVNLPEPYFMRRGDYFFLSLDAENLALMAKDSDTGDNLAHDARYAGISQGIPADSTFLVWYDIERSEPFFIHGTGMLADILRLYANGVAAVRITPAELKVSLFAERVKGGGARLLPGYPLSPSGSSPAQGRALLEGKVSPEDFLAFRFDGDAKACMAFLRDRSVLVLADSAGAKIAEARLEPDSLLVPETGRPGSLAALWAVSPGGTVWRFGPKLAPLPPFPVATGISSPMPPAVLGGRLALFSRADSALVFVGPEGARSVSTQRLDSPLFLPPDFRSGRMAFYPKSFEAKVHLSDSAGGEAPGWPVQASGISVCAPRFLQNGQSLLVSFMTQAGALFAWDSAGAAVAGFPVSLPGVFFATPEPIVADGEPALVCLAQDGSLSLVGMDGSVLRQTRVPDIDGKTARLVVADIDAGGDQEIFLYGSGAFIAGYSSSLRPLDGFPVKGVARPQLIDLDRDGRLDLMTAGLDGNVYAYTLGRARQ